MTRLLLLALASIVLLIPGTAAAQQYVLSANSLCAIASPPGDSIYVTWNVQEPAGPDQHPNWVGYDIYRRVATPCGASFVRVSDDMIPRATGQVFTTHYWGEVAPATATLFEYLVQPVDANRQPYTVGGGFCASCNTFQICPPYSAPITKGTLEDLGWALLVQPCPGTCYPTAYIEDAQVVDQLRPYAGTSATFDFFGLMTCGTVEGCALWYVEHYEQTTCVTPTTRRSWGAIKTIYR